MSRERLSLGPCATVNQQQPWMRMANHKLSRHSYDLMALYKSLYYYYYYYQSLELLGRRVSFCSFCEQFHRKIAKSHTDRSFSRLSKSLGLSRISGAALTGKIHHSWDNWSYRYVNAARSCKLHAALYTICTSQSRSRNFGLYNRKWKKLYPAWARLKEIGTRWNQRCLNIPTHTNRTCHCQLGRAIALTGFNGGLRFVCFVRFTTTVVHWTSLDIYLFYLSILCLCLCL